MKLSLACYAAPFFALTTASLTTHAEPRFENCSIEHEDIVRPAIQDAIHLSGLAASAVGLILDAAQNASDTRTINALNASSASALVERYFGTDALPTTAAGIVNSEYLYRHYTRMHDMLSASAFTYRCMSSDAKVRNHTLCGNLTLAFVKNPADKNNGTVWNDLTYSGINLCPYIFDLPRISWRKSWQKTVEGWTKYGKNDTIILKYSVPAIILHEMSHELAVEGSKAVIDMPVLGVNFTVPLEKPKNGDDMAYGVDDAQLLAMADTNLAMHNANNYALFIVEAAVTSIDGIVPPEVDTRPFLIAEVGQDGNIEYERANHHEATPYVKSQLNKTNILEVDLALVEYETLRVVAAPTASATRQSVEATETGAV